MLRDVNQSLAAWLGRALPPGAGLRFEAPDPRWLAHPPEPLFVDVFLHTIGPDARGQQSGWSSQRDDEGRVVGRQLPAQYFRLGYLITAWAAAAEADGDLGGRVAAEHELLGLLLNACANQSVLPPDALAGSLAEGGRPVVVECAAVDSPAAVAALWPGLGVPPRAHLDLILVAPAEPPVLTEIAPPAREIVLSAAQPGLAAGGQPTPGTGPAFGTRRQWERQTTREPPAGRA